jgi:type I restriction enzyme S subunit
MAKTTTLPSGWKYPKAREVFESVTDKSHNGELQVLSATQDRGIVPRSAMNIDISFDEKSLPTYKRVVPGNFVIHLRSFQGGLAYSGLEGIISPAYVILKPKDRICGGYYKYLFQSVDYIKRLNVAVYGIRDGKQISYDSFGIIRIPLPPLAEQRRIAEILATQDRLIAAKTRLIDAKKRQKRWLMQNLLTGKIRLSGFSDEWKRVKLEDIGELERGAGLQKSDFIDIGVGCIHYGQIYTFYGEIAYQTKSFVSKSLAKNLNVVHSNDLIITATSENIEDICKTVAWLGKEDIVTGGHAVICHHDQNPKFLSYYTGTRQFFDEKRKYARGTKVIEISVNDMAKIELLLPPLSEQSAIAERLVAADKEIELLSRELEQQKLVKKYLMQQLLTGKKLVKEAKAV